MDNVKTSFDNDITDGLKIISYVAGNDGNHELVSDSMWHPVNIVNRQAWQEIDKKIEYSKAKVATGKVSCLHYYMTSSQMDTGLLAKYTGQPRWLVCLHMIPFFYNRLGAKVLNKYVKIFKVPLQDLIQGQLGAPVNNEKVHNSAG
ncbi:MAG: hypothetical protein WBB23_07865 [Desulforhopalus sp.]